MNLLLIILILTLNSCAQFTLIETKRTMIGDLYTVEPQIPWNEYTSGKTQTWTVDGPALNELRFVNGIEDNEAPFEITGQEKDKSPKFKKGLTFLEIKDLIVDGFVLTGAHKLKTHRLTPIHFGEIDGFRFEFEFVTEEGLEKEGLVIGTVIKDRLFFISYIGARVHYFPKYKDHVEKIISSIKMVNSASSSN